jgi:hypothetical protein
MKAGMGGEESSHLLLVLLGLLIFTQTGASFFTEK